jgi:hypothetical protein
MSQEALPQRRFEQQEILGMLNRFAENAELTLGRSLEDENGLYLLEATAKEADGGTVEYNFGRKGQYPECLIKTTSIHRTFYDTEGIPYTGDGLARYNEGTGEWEDTV